MKKIIFISYLFIISQHIFGQKYVGINFVSCKNEDRPVSLIFEYYKIFKNDSLYKTDVIDEIGYFEILEPAKYSVVYKNLFDEEIRREFIIDKGDKYRDFQLNLCVDKLQDTIKKKLVFESMKTGENIKIRFKYAGCFGNNNDSIVIRKEKNKYSLIHKKRKRKLKPFEINYIVEYENELKHLKEKNFISTLNAVNEITFNSEKYFYFEPSIFWGGYEALKKKLKLR